MCQNIQTSTTFCWNLGGYFSVGIAESGLSWSGPTRSCRGVPAVIKYSQSCMCVTDLRSQLHGQQVPPSLGAVPKSKSSRWISVRWVQNYLSSLNAFWSISDSGGARCFSGFSAGQLCSYWRTGNTAVRWASSAPPGDSLSALYLDCPTHTNMFCEVTNSLYRWIEAFYWCQPAGCVDTSSSSCGCKHRSPWAPVSMEYSPRWWVWP